MNEKAALLLMSHGDFAKELIKSAELIVGKQDNFETLGVHLNDQIDDLKAKMFTKIDTLNTENGLIVFTDIIGGSPMNLSGYLLERDNILICSGMNLPILLECLLNRDKPMDELENKIRTAYADGMTIRRGLELSEEDEDDLLL